MRASGSVPKREGARRLARERFGAEALGMRLKAALAKVVRG